MNVLFRCTGNSCRSILGEAIFNHLAPAGWKAMSAGSRATGQVHPRVLALLAREGIPTQGLHSKSWDNLLTTPDIVITVCSSAAGETCPIYLGHVLRTHWDVEDPARATGSRWGSSIGATVTGCCSATATPRPLRCLPPPRPLGKQRGFCAKQCPDFRGGYKLVELQSISVAH